MAKFAGADVVGCDLSPEACGFTENRLGIPVHQSALQTCSSAIGSVDAVVMRDLIEHPADPLNDLRAARDILGPGGLLLLYTPNGGEAGTNVETAREWVGFRVDLEHLQYLSPQTVNWLSRAFDLRIERLIAYGFPNLKGMDKLPELPNRKSGFTHSARIMIKRIRGIRRLAAALRAFRAELIGESGDPRLGSYRLFTILRKA
jgi:SAM-dependent methyltransferase